MKKTFKKKDNRIAATAVITSLLLLLIILAVYIGLAQYYKGGFSYGTWINGIYCTGKTVEEVNRELATTCSYEGLTISDKTGDTYEIKAKDIGFTFDFIGALESYMQSQNPYMWISNLLRSKEHTLLPVVSYDKNRLDEIMSQLPFLKDEKSDKDRRIYIAKTVAGYQLVNERRDVLDIEKAKQTIAAALMSFQEETDLNAEGCYSDLPMTEADKQILSEWDMIEEFQDCRIRYRFGDETVPIDASVVWRWIAEDKTGQFLMDKEGHLQADDDKIRAYVDELADRYDTVGSTRKFNASRKETVVIEGGTYGNEIDRKAEKKYLVEAFHRNAEEEHTPVYLKRAWKQGSDDIGNTYIEIDMTEQKMYYYKDGRMLLETEIVTGSSVRRMETPSGVNFVYAKQENRILRGPNYASHVNFWMPVKGNIGIHDAAWRNEYGGDIYKTNGSHGCINTPYEEMSKLYNMVETGTPVVMFY